MWTALRSQGPRPPNLRQLLPWRLALQAWRDPTLRTQQDAAELLPHLLRRMPPPLWQASWEAVLHTEAGLQRVDGGELAPAVSLFLSDPSPDRPQPVTLQALLLGQSPKAFFVRCQKGGGWEGITK